MRLRARGQPFTDTNIILMGASFYCGDCGMKFRELGVSAGINFDAPCTTDKGEVTVFPLVPIDEEPQLQQVGTC